MKFLRKILLIVFAAMLFVLVFASRHTVNAAESLNIMQKEISLPEGLSTEFYSNTYSASTPEVNSFFDANGRYNVAYFYGSELTVQRYSAKLKLDSTIRIAPPSGFSLYGNIIADDAGNYYVCWGNCDYNSSNAVVISLCKYNYAGKQIGALTLRGFDLAPYSPVDYWGTKIPFDAGTCSLAINGNILACNYARKMYSGHQSNHVFYLNCDTMERVYLDYPYVSHSFDQDCLATTDGGFIMANHGDAYNRGFEFTKITPDGYEGSSTIFHFREGSNRSHGYNETYAQLGGLAELNSAYVFCGSSEKTLSLDVAPTKGGYCSYSEARNLFVQFLKKDFYNYAGAHRFAVIGEIRRAEGTPPQNAETELWLYNDTTDFGIHWLTDYEAPYFVANPKILSLPQNRALILWEKRNYDSNTLIESFFMILNSDGSTYRKATSIGRIALPTNADIVYNDGTVYWTTVRYGDAHINFLDVDGHNYTYTVTKKPTCTAKGVGEYQCTDCNKKWTPAGTKSVAKINHKYSSDADTSCNKCGAFAYPGGNTLYKDTDGKWYHVVNRKKIKDTTLVKYNGTWYYVKDGVKSNANTLVKYNGKWYHVKGGKWVKDTTIVKYNGTWYYVRNGIKNNANTLVKYNGKWYHVKGGKFVKDTTIVKYNDTWYYVRNGIKNNANTLAKYNGKWYHVKGGKFVKDTTIVKYNGTWYYVRNGIKSNANTLAKYNGKWYHVDDGKFVKDTTLVKYNGTWYYVRRGIKSSANTLVKYNGKWFHVDDGKLQNDTTLVKYNGKWRYVSNGKLDPTFTGRFRYNGKYYTVRNGVVV